MREDFSLSDDAPFVINIKLVNTRVNMNIILLFLSTLILAGCPLWAHNTNCLRYLQIISIEANYEFERSRHQPSGRHGVYHLAYVKSSLGPKIPLHRLEPIEIRGPVELKFVFQKPNEEPFIVQWPRAMTMRFLEYLRIGGMGLKPYDCNMFAHDMNGVPCRMGWFDRDQWHVKANDHSKLLPGDTIMITANGYFVHFAIYVGQRFYLSKFGTRGSLFLADLQQMKQFYDGDAVYCIIPKPINSERASHEARKEALSSKPADEWVAAPIRPSKYPLTQFERALYC